MKSLLSAVFNIFRYAGRTLTFIRNTVFNLFFLVLCAAIASAILFTTKPPELADNSVLVLSLNGDIVEEQRHPPALDKYVDEYLGLEGQPRKIPLQDILDIIYSAADDERLSMLLLDLKRLGSIGLTQMQDIGDALEHFKKSGKKIVAAEDFYTQTQYFLASFADTIIINSMGGVELHGLGTYNLYFNELIDKLKVNYHVFRVGTYKSAIEPFTRNSMSAEAKEQNAQWLGSFWKNYVDTVSDQRDLSPEVIGDYIENLSSNLLITGGDTARMAKNAGLVDKVFTRSELQTFLKSENHQDPSEKLQTVSTSAYIPFTDFSFQESEEVSDAIGLIIAEGNIVGGKQPAGVIGSESLAEKLRAALHDSKIKAVVLRINSGGGSAFASEVIRQEILELKKAGKPVVVSMGSMAASGGYWIASAADLIYASPSTLTGSIGIFGAVPTFENSLKEIGVYSDGVGTTSLAAGLNLAQPLPQPLKESIQLIVDSGYDKFLSVVSEGRGMERDTVMKIAEGRVYSGEKAQELGLVDDLGSLENALQSAAELAGIDGAPAVYIEHKGTITEKILQQFTEIMIFLSPKSISTEQILIEASKIFQSDLAATPLLSDPKHVYAHSMLKLNF